MLFNEQSLAQIPMRPANLAAPSPVTGWPAHYNAAMFLSFDVDAETAWTSKDPAHADRLVTMSYGGYENRVGVNKLLEMLESLQLTATFFIPGWVADVYPAMVEKIATAGHEIGHHGYHHLLPDPGADYFSAEISKGFESLAKLGITPTGYRAPFGENCYELLQVLQQAGIKYSSSWRDDVMPYRHIFPDQREGIVELPVTASYDDWMHGLCARFSPRTILPREQVLSMWQDELDEVRAWGAMVTTVIHPQVSGRPMRLRLLREFLEYAIEKNDVWITTGENIYQHFLASEIAK
ncbi:polysaccharide deacetylase [Erwiniaceae bacterium BAC15a-03b]|uniref:Polysaccharide deacetylase n=1 Tax=Winslowiella arboricola TaxID=2978220 RepID=A0A9J6PML0_9GAMM|nr:polysaccharide deacetylase [Winslowiella arboricola]MCU5772600.1 polysaccharide deacetylase [Winslowiella arboricola]MCU5778634.1 polysaccharide deacetylase [Winslowiella arboricola]